MLILLLTACGPATTGEALVLTGWEFHWEDLSHRVSLVRVGLEQDSTLQLGLIGGDFSTGQTMVDTPHYRVRFQRVRAPGLRAWEGRAVFDVGPEGGSSGTVRVEAPGVDGDLVAVLQGFAINTDVPQPAGYPADYDPGYGYTSAGFGVLLGDPVVGTDTVEVPVELALRWAPQDREDMNAAMLHAHADVEVRVLVMAFKGVAEPTSVTGSTEYPYDPPYTEQPPLELPVEVSGPGAEGFVAWRGFDLRGSALGEDAGQGDYLRAFGAELSPERGEKGLLAGTLRGTLSTTSLIEFTQLGVDFQAELVRAGMRDAAVDHYVVEGTFPTGDATVGPTLDG